MNLTDIAKVDNANVYAINFIHIALPSSLESDYRRQKKFNCTTYSSNLSEVFDYFLSQEIPFLVDIALNDGFNVDRRGNKEIYILYKEDMTPYIKLSDELFRNVLDDFNKSLCERYKLMSII